MTRPFSCLLSVLCAVTLLTGAALADAARVITVTGEGVVDAAPDMATVTLGVSQSDAEAQVAMSAVSTAVAGILEGLRAAGIAPSDLQTRSLRLRPVWDYDPNGRRQGEITGFEAANTVQVQVRDIDRLGAILDQVIADGANRFEGLSFGIADPAPQMDAARRAAVADAMAKARLLAEAAGVALGPLRRLSESGSGPRPMRMEMASADSAPGGNVPVAPGELTFRAQVSMEFNIAP